MNDNTYDVLDEITSPTESGLSFTEAKSTYARRVVLTAHRHLNHFK